MLLALRFKQLLDCLVGYRLDVVGQAILAVVGELDRRLDRNGHAEAERLVLDAFEICLADRGEIFLLDRLLKRLVDQVVACFFHDARPTQVVFDDEARCFARTKARNGVLL